MQKLFLPVLAIIAVELSACSNQASDSPGVAASAKEPAATTSGPEMTAAAETDDSANSAAGSDNGDCVAELPFARGKTFCSLDEYLAHLEALGAVDLPWWREISPGVYEHVKRMPEAEREIATREELMERFGFKR